MPYLSTILADTPLRYYRLGESSGTTAKDLGSQAQDGTITSVAYGITGLLIGDSNTAFTFNGSTSNVSLPATGIPTGNAAWTQECWIMTPAVFSIGVGGYQVIMMIGHQGGNLGYALFLKNVGGNIKIGVNGYSSNEILWATTVTTSTIYHIAATWDGTTLILYVNGLQAASVVPSALAITGGVASIGTAVPPAANYYVGVIDEVTIYSIAISAVRVAAHYNAGTTLSAVFGAQSARREDKIRGRY